MSVSVKNLALVMKLLTRAGHPETPEEEARTAAVKAARMIYEQGFIVSSPEEAKSTPPPATSSEKRAAQHATRTAAQTAAAASRANVAYAQQVMDIFDRQAPRGTRRSQPVTGPILIAARYEGFCKACGRAYACGEPVAWKPGGGVTHAECKEYWDTAR